MHKLTVIASLLALSAPAIADTPAAPAEKTPYICWYNASGDLTAAQPSTRGGPLHFVVTGHGGDKTYAYGVRSTDGKDCPVKVRK